MKVFLYILRNSRNNYYIGITKLEPELRLLRHKRGDVKSTRYKGPWRLIYSEAFNSLQEARLKEKLIKSWHGGNAFKNFLTKAAESSIWSCVFWLESKLFSFGRKKIWRGEVGQRPAPVPLMAGGSSNGRTHPFGGWYRGSRPWPPAMCGRAVYLGSNPSPAALQFSPFGLKFQSLRFSHIARKSRPTNQIEN